MSTRERSDGGRRRGRRAAVRALRWVLFALLVASAALTLVGLPELAARGRGRALAARRARRPARAAPRVHRRLRRLPVRAGARGALPGGEGARAGGAHGPRPRRHHRGHARLAPDGASAPGQGPVDLAGRSARPSPEVRALAAEVVRHRPRERGARAGPTRLVELLGDPSPEVRREARASLVGARRRATSAARAPARRRAGASTGAPSASGAPGALPAAAGVGARRGLRGAAALILRIVIRMSDADHDRPRQRPAAAGRAGRGASPTVRSAAYIAENGLKHSRQRDRIAETFFGMGGHVTVEELVARARRLDPRVERGDRLPDDEAARRLRPRRPAPVRRRADPLRGGGGRARTTTTSSARGAARSSSSRTRRSRRSRRSSRGATASRWRATSSSSTAAARGAARRAARRRP